MWHLDPGAGPAGLFAGTIKLAPLVIRPATASPSPSLETKIPKSDPFPRPIYFTQDILPFPSAAAVERNFLPVINLAETHPRDNVSKARGFFFSPKFLFLFIHVLFILSFRQIALCGRLFVANFFENYFSERSRAGSYLRWSLGSQYFGLWHIFETFSERKKWLS